MATRRNRTQRKNKNKNKNRSRKHSGGAASMSCDEAASINANPNSYGMVKKMAAKVQLKSCAVGSKNVVAPTQNWSSMLPTRSRRNRKHRGGAASMSCNNARLISNDPSAGRVKKMAATLQLKVCNDGGKASVAPNMKWANTRINSGKFKKCNAGYSPNGQTCLDGAAPHLPSNYEEASSPRAF